MRKLLLAISLLLGGLAIFVLGNPYYTIFPTNWNQTYYIGLAIFFLVLTLVLKRVKSLSEYWPAAYALFIASAVFGASHVNATYEFPGGGVVFGVVVFILGVVGAHAMLKDEGLLGPVLFHAGYDLLIIVPILNS